MTAVVREHYRRATGGKIGQFLALINEAASVGVHREEGSCNYGGARRKFVRLCSHDAKQPSDFCNSRQNQYGRDLLALEIFITAKYN